jgi:hypothetical protein
MGEESEIQNLTADTQAGAEPRRKIGNPKFVSFTSLIEVTLSACLAILDFRFWILRLRSVQVLDFRIIG